MHSLLSKPTILENLGMGVIIHPFIPQHLKSASYDVRIGKNYYLRKSGRETGDAIFNPFSPKAIERHFGAFIEAKPAKCTQSYRDHPDLWDGIDPDDRVILLEPGEMMLGHTEEYIGGTLDPLSGRCFLAEMKARSSVGRLGFEVCRCAGWGDVGYVNRWTMEVVNTSNTCLPLVIGMRVAQMKFYEVDPVDPCDLYGNDSGRDHYQTTTNLEELQKKWRPEMMLPRITKT